MRMGQERKKKHRGGLSWLRYTVREQRERHMRRVPMQAMFWRVNQSFWFGGKKSKAEPIQRHDLGEFV
jgi:hypothetical protein